MRKEIIGDCTLYHGNSLDIMEFIGVVDHVICDPPYEALVHDNNKKLSKGRALKDKRNPFQEWDFESVEKIRDPFVEKIKCNGWFVGFCIVEGVKPWEETISKHGLKYKRTCLWIKPDGMPQFNGQCPGLGYECFVTAWCGKGHSKWNGGGKHGVYYCNKGDNRYGGHPTEKPIKLMSEIIKDFTNENDVVLDPFMGSGTTGVACVKLNRKFIGIELNEKYFELSCKRINEAVKQYENDMFTGYRKPKQDNLF